jgi:hypothetical protein
MAENYSLIWEIFYDLSDETQEKLLNSATNLRYECAMKDQDMTLGQALYVIFETVKFLDGKDIQRE